MIFHYLFQIKNEITNDYPHICSGPGIAVDDKMENRHPFKNRDCASHLLMEIKIMIVSDREHCSMFLQMVFKSHTRCNMMCDIISLGFLFSGFSYTCMQAIFRVALRVPSL